MMTKYFITTQILAALFVAPLFAAAQDAGTPPPMVPPKPTGVMLGTPPAPPTDTKLPPQGGPRIMPPVPSGSNSTTGLQPQRPSGAPQLTSAPRPMTPPQGINDQKRPGGMMGSSSAIRMMGSSTRPLPPQLMRDIEMRDRLAGTGTPRVCTTDAKGKTICASDERANAMKERVAAERREVAMRVANRMAGRLSAMADRLTTLADRIDSRIQKMKQNGKVTTGAEASVSDARKKIENARSIMAKLSTVSPESYVEEKSGTTTPIGGVVRTDFDNVRIALVDAHKALADAVTQLLNSGSGTPPVRTTPDDATNTITQ